MTAEHSSSVTTEDLILHVLDVVHGVRARRRAGVRAQLGRLGLEERLDSPLRSLRPTEAATAAATAASAAARATTMGAAPGRPRAEAHASPPRPMSCLRPRSCRPGCEAAPAACRPRRWRRPGDSRLRRLHVLGAARWAPRSQRASVARRAACPCDKSARPHRPTSCPPARAARERQGRSFDVEPPLSGGRTCSRAAVDWAQAIGGLAAANGAARLQAAPRRFRDTHSSARRWYHARRQRSRASGRTRRWAGPTLSRLWGAFAAT